MKRLFFFVSLIFLLSGCSQVKQTKDIPVMYIGQSSYPEYEGDFEELVKYIPLETNDDVLIDTRRQLLHFSDNRIVMLNLRQGDICVFDGKGKVLSHFNHKGQGPQEYTDLRYSYGSVVVYDEDDRTIYIMESRGRCQIYAEDGRYLRNFYFSTDGKQYSEAYNFDKESILAFNANMETDSAYFLLSKKDGTILSCIDVPLHDRISNRKTVQIESRTMVQSGLPRQQLLKDGDDFIFAEFSSDTIYRFTKDKRLIPLLTRTPPVMNGKSNEAYLVFQPLKVTDTYVLGYSYVHDFQQPRITQLLYDMKKRQTFKCGDSSIEYFVGGYNIEDRTDLPAGVYVMNGFPDRILNQIKAGELEGTKIKEIAETLDAEDNPVLQIIKFK
jgi:hypothetical protein